MEESALTTLTDKHPVYLELRRMLDDGKEHAIGLLSNPSLSAEERHFYSGSLHNITELSHAIEEARQTSEPK